VPSSTPPRVGALVYVDKFTRYAIHECGEAFVWFSLENVLAKEARSICFKFTPKGVVEIGRMSGKLSEEGFQFSPSNPMYTIHKESNLYATPMSASFYVMYHLLKFSSVMCLQGD